jgi:hypothetical protein
MYHSNMSKVESIFPDQVVSFYADLPVRNYKAALTWYEQLLGCPPTFLVSDREAVWELAEHRSVFLEKMPKRAGHALHTICSENFDDFITQASRRGLEPVRREEYGNGVRKAIDKTSRH